MQEPKSKQESLIDYGQDLAEAQQAFKTFVDAIPLTVNITIVCDGDVDGLGAGVVLWHCLTRRGLGADNITVLQPDKGENAFTPSTRGYVARAHPRALFVLDLGISDRQIIHSIPTLFVDHHKPSGIPSEGVAISGYDWDPVPTSSLLTYLLCNAHGNVADKAWVAAIGNLGDIGPKYPELDTAAREQKLK